MKRIFIVAICLCVGTAHPGQANPLRGVLEIMKLLTRSADEVARLSADDLARLGTRTADSFPVLPARRLANDFPVLSTRRLAIGTDDPLAVYMPFNPYRPVHPAAIDARFRRLDVSSLNVQGFVPRAADEIAEIAAAYRGPHRQYMSELLTEFGYPASAFNGGIERTMTRLAAAQPDPPNYLFDLTTGKVTINRTGRIGSVEIEAPSFNLYKTAAVAFGVPYCVNTDSCREMFSDSPEKALNSQKEQLVRTVVSEVMRRMEPEAASEPGSAIGSRPTAGNGVPSLAELSPPAPEWWLGEVPPMLGPLPVPPLGAKATVPGPE